jgi:hypothetical protein
MYRRNLDIFIAGGLALLGGAAYEAHVPGPVQVVLGIALFFAPGYLWSEAILSQRLTGVERVMTSAGMSLILPILGGFLFYGLRISLFRSAWVGLLVVLSLLGVVAVAIVRLREQPAPPEAQPGPAAGQRPGGNRRALPHVIIYGAAALVALGSVAFSVHSAQNQKFPGRTMFWLQPDTAANAVKASLGATNYQGVTEQYEVKLLEKNKVIYSHAFTLANGQTWQTPVKYTTASGDSLVANLYLLPDSSKPYLTTDNGQPASTASASKPKSTTAASPATTPATTPVPTAPASATASP